MVSFAKGFVRLVLGCVVFNTATLAVADTVKITKVNPFHLNENSLQGVGAEARMVEFEPLRLLHGAVTKEEIEARYGFYFSIFWKTSTRESATVRLEYRHGATGAQLYTKELRIDNPKRKNVTKFQVIGDEYARLGKVTQWKVSILESDEVVAEYKSFLWK